MQSQHNYGAYHTPRSTITAHSALTAHSSWCTRSVQRDDISSRPAQPADHAATTNPCGASGYHWLSPTSRAASVLQVPRHHLVCHPATTLCEKIRRSEKFGTGQYLLSSALCIVHDTLLRVDLNVYLNVFTVFSTIAEHLASGPCLSEPFSTQPKLPPLLRHTCGKPHGAIPSDAGAR